MVFLTYLEIIEDEVIARRAEELRSLCRFYHRCKDHILYQLMEEEIGVKLKDVCEDERRLKCLEECGPNELCITICEEYGFHGGD